MIAPYWEKPGRAAGFGNYIIWVRWIPWHLDFDGFQQILYYRSYRWCLYLPIHRLTDQKWESSEMQLSGERNMAMTGGRIALSALLAWEYWRTNLRQAKPSKNMKMTTIIISKKARSSFFWGRSPWGILVKCALPEGFQSVWATYHRKMSK